MYEHLEHETAPLLSHELANREALDEYVKQQKREYPVVESAYKPSGESAPGAVGKLVGAGVRELVTLLLVSLAIAIGSLAVIWLSAWVASWPVNLKIVFVLAIALVYAGPVLAATICFGIFASIGRGIEKAAVAAKCRNPRLARSITVVLALLGCVIFAATIVLLAPVVPTWGWLAPLFAPRWWTLAGAGLGVLLALWLSFDVDLASLGKYCEKCQTTMVQQPLGVIDLARLPALKAALLDARHDDERAPIVQSQEPVRVLLFLYRCESCSSGYLDGVAKLDLHFHHLKDGKQSESQKWLCLSTSLLPDAVTWCRDQATPDVRPTARIE